MPVTIQNAPTLREHIDMLEAERGESLPEHLMLRILADHIERLEHEVNNLKHRQDEIARILKTR
jgi:hypothetical protein